MESDLMMFWMLGLPLGLAMWGCVIAGFILLWKWARDTL